MALLTFPLWAANTVVTVEQVTEAVTLTDNVDYHITSTEPFTTTGSINIQNTAHAVVILDNVKPSEAVKMLGFITIDGKKATSAANCQVKIYNRGALILPYGNTNALITFTESNFKGDSCTSYSLINDNGFMNTLTEGQLNNKMKSFKLKRGYMVTFATQASGYGYQRCFIAADEDLEMNLPAILAGRVSSYRLFKWNDCSKAGLPGTTSTTDIDLVNATWCYSWGTGASTMPNAETVPHHIYEDYPSAESLGGVTYSCHMKTNNEPNNTSDDPKGRVETVDEVLANWQGLMRTGLRLCSPSQHDGGLGWTAEFFDSIDARGWRCDIFDIHCYWPEGSYSGLGGYYTKYGRPIWISEFLWGASWNSNGVFASSDPDNDNATVMARILNNLNSWDYIERYAYWIHESRGKLFSGSTLTKTGQFYADMNTGLGYKSNKQYVPRTPRMYAPSITSADYTPSTKIYTIKLNEKNGEYCDSILLERQDTENGPWQIIQVLDIQEKGGTYTLKDTIEQAGQYAYRVREVLFNKQTLTSSIVYNIINGATGGPDFSYGQITASSTDESYNYYTTAFEEKPVVVLGSPTNNNNKLAPVEHVTAVNNDYFSFKYYPWSKSYYQTFDKSETSTFIVAKQGVGKVGELNYEASYITDDEGSEKRVGTDEVQVTFKQPFSTTPVVLATPYKYNTKYPIMWRIYDVTPQGFKIVMRREKSYTGNITPSYCAYLAVETGQSKDGYGKIISAGTDTITYKTNTAKQLEFGGYELTNPMLLVQTQSLNRDAAMILRINKSMTSTAARIRAQIDSTDVDNLTISAKMPLTEAFGWITISDDPDYVSGITPQTNTAAAALRVVIRRDGNAISITDPSATVATLYNTRGQQYATIPLNEGQTTYNTAALPAGLYIIKTNAAHTVKFIKR